MVSSAYFGLWSHGILAAPYLYWTTHAGIGVNLLFLNLDLCQFALGPGAHRDGGYSSPLLVLAMVLWWRGAVSWHLFELSGFCFAVLVPRILLVRRRSPLWFGGGLLQNGEISEKVKAVTL